MEVPVTQRAYTLRLNGIDPNDRTWRDKLWLTHEAVNKGAKAFGDWLLTMRGGLCHTLANMPVGKDGRVPIDEERKDRRIVLALSWLSVESEKGAPGAYIVLHKVDAKTGKREEWNTEGALREILQSRGASDAEIESWVSDCKDSLSAEIRDDAVWVNRSKAFNEAFGGTLNRNEVWDMLGHFFTGPEAYLKTAKLKNSSDDGGDSSEDEKAKDLVQKAGQWLSSRFGTGEGADFERMSKVYEGICKLANEIPTGGSGRDIIALIAEGLSAFSPSGKDLKGVLKLISGPGYKSATRNLLSKINNVDSFTEDDSAKLEEASRDDSLKCKGKTGVKGKRDYADAILKDVQADCGFTYLQDDGPARHQEFAVMLDHAARRVSLAHTWIKKAEAERRKFDEDAGKIENVPSGSRSWLDSFCEERSKSSGALEPYRIRKRAVDGWKDLVSAWSKPGCNTEDDRKAAARALQDNPEIDKFGDIQLFEALAATNAEVVWKTNGRPDPQPLLDYVTATDAEFKKRRFKVPAYRHPDPLLHPVFCDFGTSRWDISFSISETPNQRLNMKLYRGGDINEVGLCWQSKKFNNDLFMYRKGEKGGPDITRADRFGRAAGGTPKDGPASIIGLFDENNWNGRLQAPRKELEKLAVHIEKHNWDNNALRIRNNLNWLISFSARLHPQGPWMDYALANGLKPNPIYWPHGEANKKRSGLARLTLSRLPSLRVVSVDLGHRYAAACAVWETLTPGQIKADCAEAGHAEPGPEDMYMHLRRDGKTTVYRRIGPDILEEVDGATGEIKEVPHPVPWAKLDRQFLIKLQGEDRDARMAGQEEIKAVQLFEEAIGRTLPDKRKCGVDELSPGGYRDWPAEALPDKRKSGVDELMSEAVRTARLGLERHGRRARIAYNLTTDTKTMPGGIPVKLSDDGRVELLCDTLLDWHGLFSGKGWEDGWAKALWEEHIKVELPEPKEAGAASPQMRKKQRAELKEKIKPFAEDLGRNKSLRMKLHVLWATRWREEDEIWHDRLRWLRKWILPRGKDIEKSPEIRNVGGLSLARLATITEFRRKVQVAYFTRLRPDGSKCEIKEKFAQKSLDALEHMRENRVKQLASRLVEAALGIGIEKPRVGNKDQMRPRERLDKEKGGRFAPCHAVVIENLTKYKPEETRKRIENRRLMQWASSKVKKYLAESCQLNGLHLREVSAGYTSRQDCSTGAPGIRCTDVSVAEFVREGGYLSKRIKEALTRACRPEATEEDKYIASLYSKWDAEKNAWTDTKGVAWHLAPDGKWLKDGEPARKGESPHPVRIPWKGGEVFVSANDGCGDGKKRSIQADLNAAANIGLKALLDPDWPGRWWYVPCNAKDFMPVKDKVSGSSIAALKEGVALTVPSGEHGSEASRGKRKGDNKAREVVNLWRDPSGAEIKSGGWKKTKDYWEDVKERVVRLLCKQSGLSEMP
jgi:IS605 OrfB family transposase